MFVKSDIRWMRVLLEVLAQGSNGLRKMFILLQIVGQGVCYITPHTCLLAEQFYSSTRPGTFQEYKYSPRFGSRSRIAQAWPLILCGPWPATPWIDSNAVSARRPMA